MSSPWLSVEPLDAARFSTLRRRAIFDCGKWDPQVGDSCTLARYPLVITREAWREVSTMAERLANEALAAEIELTSRPELVARLGLPRAVRRAVVGHRNSSASTRGIGRITRFDFHYTTDGWRISEGNSDVPGGLNEASGLPLLMTAHYAGFSPVGDPLATYAAALAGAAGDAGRVALVYATAYSDDQQMMVGLSRALRQRGLTTHLVSPAHVEWQEGQARLRAAWASAPLDVIARFFPAEWLPALGRRVNWACFFRGGHTPTSNPGTAVLTQTKRFPLVWDALRAPLPTWRALLPETRDPRHAPWRTKEWVIKPALGRVGEGVGIVNVTTDAEMHRIDRNVRWWPRAWAAQRRFEIVPCTVGGVAMYPCLGVYTIDGRVVGAYGRVSAKPLIDAQAADAAVLAA